MAETHYPPYDQHAQILLAHLGEIECTPGDIVNSEQARAEAEDFLTSFVQHDKPDDPDRYRRIARRLVEFMAAFAPTARDDGTGYNDEDYRRLKTGISDILVEGLGEPKGRYYE